MYLRKQCINNHVISLSFSSTFLTFINIVMIFIFSCNIVIISAYDCTVLDVFTRQLTIKPSPRSDCTSFEGTGFIELNGYNSLLGILTDTLSVEDMVLNYTLLGNNGVKEFANWYVSNQQSSTPSNIERIALQLNDVSDLGVQALAHALCSSQTGCDTSPVKILSLHTNDIGYGGAKAIADIITNTDKGLEIINLGENHIGETGGEVLGIVSKVYIILYVQTGYCLLTFNKYIFYI